MYKQFVLSQETRLSREITGKFRYRCFGSFGLESLFSDHPDSFIRMIVSRIAFILA